MAKPSSSSARSIPAHCASRSPPRPSSGTKCSGALGPGASPSSSGRTRIGFLSISYEVAIVSHERADSVEDHTLGLLDRLGVGRDRVTFFVTEDQWPEYERLGVRLVDGRYGLPANRNRLATYFPPGVRVLSLDDDLLSISVRQDDRMKAISPDEFADMVAAGFEALDEWNAALWGISPMHNDRWKFAELQVGAPMVEGPLFGFVAGRGDLTVPLDTRYEDVERVCRVFESGWNVVRLNAFVHNQSSASGGGRTDRANGCADVRRLERAYPQLVEHRFGKLASADPCRPAIRARRWVDAPSALSEVDEMRERIRFERPRRPKDEIHEWFVPNRAEPTEPKAQRIEQAIVDLRVALDSAPAYGRGDPGVDALREATQKHYTTRKPKRQLRALPE